MNLTVIKRGEDVCAPPPPETNQEDNRLLAARAREDRDAWKRTAPRELTARLQRALDALDPFAERARKRYEKGDDVTTGELWFVENRRLLESVAKNLTQLFQELEKRPKSDASRDLLVVDAAEAYLAASSVRFDRNAVEAYATAAQQDRPWTLHEVWSFKPALQLTLLERVARAAGRPEQERDEEITRVFTALIAIEQASWKELVEALSATERALSRDPVGAYRRMDFDARDRYRAAVAKLARKSACAETEVAERAVSLAEKAQRNPVNDPRAAERRSHVGYYLIDDGLPALERAVGYRPSLRDRLMSRLLRKPTGPYLLAVELIAVAVVFILVSGSGEAQGSGDFYPAWLIALLLLLPALDAAVSITNRIVTLFLPPRTPPKLDFSEGIPAEAKTLVAVPTLLLNEEQVDSMVDQLEVRYLANRDPNLLFALVTDSPDSDREVDEKDRLADYCVERMRDLNQRYSHERHAPFFLFHRPRKFNEAENVWMGWERKRGKLVELNRYLLGESDGFPVKVGALDRLAGVRYVITLDADTQLPKDVAHRLVGVMAHPLNRPVLDPETGIVTEGYALIQPRIGVSVQSAAKSRLAAVFSGETGFDIYTRAISETYQDLFGEGIFTGKGVYEVETFERVLHDRFPPNTLLSHDLIEGVHTRTGLASDLELIDDYPSRFDAYVKRKHRWVRGDWQILRWLFPRVPTGSSASGPNPLSTISKWKIFDNLRRSLLDPAVFALLICGWLFLPGGPLFWTAAVLIVFALPGYVELAFTLARLPWARHKGTALRRSLEGFAESQMHVFLFLAFLPYNTLVMLDAITRTIQRVFVTRRKLLEWTTAAEAELGGAPRGPVERYLDASAWVGLAVAAGLVAVDATALLIAGPLILLWICVKPMIGWLDHSPTHAGQHTVPGDEEFLRASALRQWRFFAENATLEDNWLVPDSVQESPRIIVHKTSPTNIGLLLNAQLAAVELGYLTTAEAVERLETVIAAVERLERPHGHLYNWYDTRTLAPVAPFFLSTVDNGNLVGCLWAVKQGLLDLIERPALSPAVKQGLLDHLRAARTQAKTPEADQLQALIERWDPSAPTPKETFSEMRRLARRLPAVESDTDWGAAIIERLDASQASIEHLAPWLDREHPLSAPKDVAATSLARTPAALDALIAEAQDDEATAALDTQRAGVTALIERARQLAARVDILVREMDFSLLFNRERKLLAVGYDASTETLERSCYDLLASEARMAVFAALAKGDIPQEAWFRLGRAHLFVDEQCVLASWTGTLFEYLMPLLWMRSYPNTLLDASMRGAVVVQKLAAGKRNVPWGVSEAGYGKCDEQGCYQYHAFGVPALALKESRPNPDFPAWVAAPYSLFLALQVDPGGATETLEALEGKGWSGRYGLYEAIDFDGDWETGRPVRSWMAHHQGMALAATCNLLCGHPFRRWFHAEPTVAAAELLLHERIPAGLAAEAEARAA